MKRMRKEENFHAEPTKSSDMSHDAEEEEIPKIRWIAEHETNQKAVVIEIIKKHKDHTYCEKIVNVLNSETSSSAGGSPQSTCVDDAVAADAATKSEASEVAESLDRPVDIVKKSFVDSVTVAEIQNSSVTSSSDDSIEELKEELDSELMESEICNARRRETAHKKYMDALHIKFLDRKRKYEESKEKYEESKQNREQLEELQNQRLKNSHHKSVRFLPNQNMELRFHSNPESTMKRPTSLPSKFI